MNWEFWLALVVMLLGLAGTILPVIPGIPLIFFAILGYAYYDHFTSLGIWFILSMGILTLAAFLADYLGGLYGAKKYGASRLGIWGSVVGGVAGLFFVPPIGIIVGPFLGAVLGEILHGEDFKKALSVGWGTLLGFLGSTIIKVIVGLIMILAFVFKVVF